MDSSRLRSKKTKRSTPRRWSAAVVYPACKRCAHAPGHHGHARTGGQSLYNGLKGQAGYRPRPMPVRPVGRWSSVLSL